MPNSSISICLAISDRPERDSGLPDARRYKGRCHACRIIVASARNWPWALPIVTYSVKLPTRKLGNNFALPGRERPSQSLSSFRIASGLLVIWLGIRRARDFPWGDGHFSAHANAWIATSECFLANSDGSHGASQRPGLGSLSEVAEHNDVRIVVAGTGDGEFLSIPRPAIADD